jgi:hypothetical protein
MSHLVARTASVAIAGLLVSWLLLAGSSPLSNWLAGQPLITNVASVVNFPTVLFALTSASSTGAVAVVAALQWLLYGFAAAWLWGKLWPNHSFKPTPLRGAA